MNMTKKNKNENFDQLLEKFFPHDQITVISRDIEAGQEFLHQFPAPKPNPAVLENIKSGIALALKAKKAHTVRFGIYKSMAVAAVLTLAALIGLKSINEQTIQPQKQASIIPAKLWESSEITADDEDLALYSAKVQQIEDELADLHENSYSDSYSPVADLETELYEIDNDFWKG
jgi:hypothetical protein